MCVAGNGDTFANTKHRVSSALAAYAPLAYKTFGSDLLSVRHRLAFLRSLVLSRLLVAVHTLVPTGRDLKAMNGCYMRGLRRIAGVPRFSPENNTTDRQVRDLLQQPSLDCLIVRARLAFAARVCRDRPAELLALLHLRVGGEAGRLPWVAQLAKDVDVLKDALAISQWPSLFEGPQFWHDKMSQPHAWSNMIDSVFFTVSVCDRQKDASGSRAVHQFVCPDCDCAFASSRALESHARVKHLKRNIIREFVPSAVCPCCQTDFVQRVRCLAHLSDRRRPRCRDWVLRHCRRLSPATVVRLDQADRELRRAAQRSGRSHVIAKGAARNSSGRVVGRASA